MKIWKHFINILWSVQKKNTFIWQDVLTVSVWLGTDVSTLIHKSITDDVFTSLTFQHSVAESVGAACGCKRPEAQSATVIQNLSNTRCAVLTVLDFNSERNYGNVG